MCLRIAVLFTFISIAWILASCSNPPHTAELAASQSDAGFYSREAREAQVEFTAYFLSNFKTVEDFKANTEANTALLETSNIPRLMNYLTGPVTHRGLGMIRKHSIKLDPNSAYVTSSGTVGFKFKYQGTWLLRNRETSGSFDLPVPFSYTLIKTPKWLLCTDQDPQHQNESFYFYFWDPKRANCDQAEHANYQIVTVKYKEIANQKLSYPEYKNMLTSGDQKNNLQMTFAFGYIKDVENPDPFKDKDENIKNFRTFLETVRYLAKTLKFEETPLLQSDYLNPRRPEARIGSRFVGMKNGIRFEIKVVAAAEIDQIDLFAKSYAHDHDAFFGWFGHSRVGSEYDVQSLRYRLEGNPEYYSISKQYQMLYWAGCTSYGYYVNPLFAMKAAVNPEQDPEGTKGLDILTNGFASPFSVYPENANVLLRVLINWDMNTSYQSIVSDLEQASTKLRRTTLVNVIGDEDNKN